MHLRSTSSDQELPLQPEKKTRRQISSVERQQESIFAKDQVAKTFGIHRKEVKKCLFDHNTDEGDPPYVFVWRDIMPFITAINNLGISAPPSPFPLPVPLNPDALKQAIMQHVAPTGVQVRFGGLLPCTVPQICIASCRCMVLSATPWAMAVAGTMLPGDLPLAKVLVSIPRSNNMAFATEPAGPGFARLWR